MEIPNIVQIVDELLRFYPAPLSYTHEFQSVKHNDYLCPTAETQLKRILESFMKYENVAYDVQGIHDRGTDVLLRFSEGDEALAANRRFLCLQIKSFQDLSEKDYLQKLKAQFAETTADRGSMLFHYYILLCTDLEAHRNRIRQINGFFSAIPNATVIDPSHCWTFLRLGESWIAAVVDKILWKGDYVRRMARNTVLDFTPHETAVLVYALCRDVESDGEAILADALQSEPFIGQVYSRVPDCPREYFFYLNHLAADKLSADEEEMAAESPSDDESDDGEFYEEEYRDYVIPPQSSWSPTVERFAKDIESLPILLSDEGRIQFDYCALRPLQAMITDAIVRYGLSGNDLAKHVISAVQIDKSLDFEDIGI